MTINAVASIYSGCLLRSLGALDPTVALEILPLEYPECGILLCQELHIINGTFESSLRLLVEKNKLSAKRRK